MKLIFKIIKLLLFSISLLLILSSVFFGYRDIPLTELKLKYAQEPSAFIAVNKLQVHIRDEGDKTDTIPIVLIHGTGSSLHTFDKWATHLKKEQRVLRLDLPGYGLTGPFINRDYSIKNYIAFLNDFLTVMKIDKCIIAGNSLGGEIAWNFTVKNPDKVAKLILIDAAGYPNESKNIPAAFKFAKIPVIKNLFTFITPKFVVRSSIENVYTDKAKVTDTLIDRYFDLSLRKGNRQAFINRFATKKGTKSYYNIKTIKQPTLILWGEDDFLIPKNNAFKFQQDLPNDTLVIIKNTGHVPMEESPDISLQPVLSFLHKN